MTIRHSTVGSLWHYQRGKPAKGEAWYLDKQCQVAIRRISVFGGNYKVDLSDGQIVAARQKFIYIITKGEGVNKTVAQKVADRPALPHMVFAPPVPEVEISIGLNSTVKVASVQRVKNLEMQNEFLMQQIYLLMDRVTELEERINGDTDD